MHNNETPLVDAIAAYIAKGRQRGHMPGHKGQARGLLSSFGELAAWDVTEADGLDDLHAPEGAILCAEHLMALAVGALKAYFLVNGATAGIQAAILAAVKPGEMLLLPRNAHRAAWTAMALGDIRPLWLEVPQTAAGLPLAVMPEQVEQALSAHPEVKAAFFVYPSFYGVCGDLAGCLAASRRHGVTTIVDEAHGAPLPFIAPDLAAARLGADLVIDSWHKSMGSLGQTAVLGCNRPDLHPEHWLTLLQTSSPSYPLLASLDAARAEWQEQAVAWAGQLRQERRLLENALAGAANLRLIDGADLPAGFAYDDTKALLYSAVGHSGGQIAGKLRECGLEPEFAAGRFALLLLTYADTVPDSLAASLAAADAKLTAVNPEGAPDLAALPLPEQAITPFYAAHADTKDIPLAAAAGCISAGLLTPYPPGIPAVGMGEVIEAEMVEKLQELMASGGKVQGVAKGNVTVICQKQQ